MRVILALLTVVFFCLLQDEAIAGDKFLLPKNYSITVDGVVYENKDSICRNFKITEAQVKDFFERSNIVSYEDIHRDYYWLSCYAYGNLNINGHNYKWQIRPIGIGMITDGKSEIWLGCKDCDAILQSPR